MPIFEITLPPLYDLQNQVAKDHTRFKVLSCGRRWGKTRMCANIAFEYAAQGKRVWWVGPVYGVSGIGWRLALMLVMQLPKELGIVVKVAERTIEWPNGGLIAFKSADHPENLRGEGLDLLIMDEADFCKEAVWAEVLRPALADRKGKAIFISTPNREGGWFHKLYMSGYPGNPAHIPYANKPLSLDKDVKSWQCSSYTNPFIDPEELNKARATSTSLVFAREFLAQFISAAGARIKKEWLQSFEKVPERLNIAIGADLAISQKTSADFTAVSAVGRDKQGFVYVLDIERGRWTFAEQQEKIIAMANKWYNADHEIKIGIENVNYQQALIQEVSKKCKYTVIGVPSVKDKVARFAPLESRYEHKQVFHSIGLPLYFEAELLSFAVDAQGKIISENDDMIDCLSDAWYVLGDISNDDAIPVGFGKISTFKGRC